MTLNKMTDDGPRSGKMSLTGPKDIPMTDNGPIPPKPKERLRKLFGTSPIQYEPKGEKNAKA